jgi:protein O-GlcNAc transferase
VAGQDVFDDVALGGAEIVEAEELLELRFQVGHCWRLYSFWMSAKQIGEMIQKGIAHHSAGRLAEAEEVYKRVLQLDARQGDALHLLGVVRHQQGRHAEAVEWIEKAIAREPERAEFYNTLGEARRGLRELEAAVEAYRRALGLKPAYAEARCNLGLALAAIGKEQEAMGEYRKAMQYRAAFADPHLHAGTLLLNAGKSVEGLEELDKAVKLKGNWGKAWYRRGMALANLKRFGEACESYQRAVSLNPKDAEAWFDLGVALERVGKLDEAIEAWKKSVDVEPKLVKGYINWAAALVQKDQRDEAEKVLRRAREIEPGSVGVNNNLAGVLTDLGRVGEAMECYEVAIGRPEVTAEIYSNALLAMHYLPRFSPGEIFERHRDWGRRFGAAGKERKYANVPDPERRLRVGYVSCDFRRHSVNYFVEPFLARHDHERFEIVCYADELWPDGVTERLRGTADVWRNTAGLSHEQLAEVIHSDRVDIVVDLMGHTAHNRLPALASKPAPIQVTYVGYPDTTGMETVDYRITDGWADPVGMTEGLHTEKLVRLPRSGWCYRSPEPSPDVSSALAREKGFVTFGSFNTLAKISREVIEVWAKILKTIPGARLILKSRALSEASVIAYVHSAFASHGITSERVELLGYSKSYADHLGLYGRIDVALDTFPYNGTTTTCEALWMGVPVIALAGKTHVSRVGVSLLNNLGLGELIASSTEDYVRLATENLARLAELRREIRPRMERWPLRDEAGFTTELEQAYRSMWQTWCQSRGRR